MTKILHEFINLNSYAVTIIYEWEVNQNCKQDNQKTSKCKL